MRALVVSIAAAASALLFSGDAFAKTAACPCSPCKCSPCICGGGGKSGKSESKHKDKDKHGHSSVGVGVNVDLGGVGQRKTEADPFAPTNESHAPHTQEKPKTKKIDKNVDTTFERVELTSEKAKELEKPEEETGTPSGAINVSDEKGESTGSPPPQTQEKEKKKKEKEPKKKKWPKPIQDWWDKKKAADEADLRTNFRRNGYEFARGIFVVNTLKSKRGEELSRLEYEARMKAHSPGATQEDKDNAKKAEKEFQKFGEEHDKDFIETPEGRKEYEKVTDAEKAAAKAHDAEKEAGKNIDSATKEAVQKAEAQGNEQPGVEEDRQEIH